MFDNAEFEMAQYFRIYHLTDTEESNDCRSLQATAIRYHIAT